MPLAVKGALEVCVPVLPDGRKLVREPREVDVLVEEHGRPGVEDPAVHVVGKLNEVVCCV